jgi:hypothetical protein
MKREETPRHQGIKEGQNLIHSWCLGVLVVKKDR